MPAALRSFISCFLPMNDALKNSWKIHTAKRRKSSAAPQRPYAGVPKVSTCKVKCGEDSSAKGKDIDDRNPCFLRFMHRISAFHLSFLHAFEWLYTSLLSGFFCHKSCLNLFLFSRDVRTKFLALKKSQLNCDLQKCQKAFPWIPLLHDSFLSFLRPLPLLGTSKNSSDCNCRGNHLVSSLMSWSAACS